MWDERAKGWVMTTDLPEPQLRAIDALIGGATTTAAAAQAGVDRSTVHRWHRDARFAAALNRAKRDHRAEVRGELRNLTSQALKALRDVLGSERYSPVLRVKIAMEVL